MKLAILVPVLLLNFYGASGQARNINCIYGITDFMYTCLINIINPDGFNNFTQINGQHNTGMTDANVQRVYGDQGSNTTNFPAAICQIFRNLRSITLLNAGIQNIDENSFSNCNNLGWIDINSNRIVSIHERSLNSNPFIEFFDISNNQLANVPEKIFENQQLLISVSFANNLITDFDDNTFRTLTILELLYVHQNRISELRHGWFKTLGRLRVLGLSWNPISELPHNIFNNLTSLQYFLAEQLNLTVFSSESFGIHRNLTIVYLQNNSINAFDEMFINNTGVYYLDMRGNICADRIIVDQFEPKYTMRAALATCIRNYNNLPVTTTTDRSTTLSTSTAGTTLPGCVGGNLDERMCQMEAMMRRMEDRIAELENRPCACK